MLTLIDKRVDNMEVLLAAVVKYLNGNFQQFLADETRKDPGIFMGVSPRGSLLLLKAAKAKALCEGRTNVLPDDIKELIQPVLLHRILFVNRRDRASKEQYLSAVVKRVAVPSEEFIGS